MATPTLQGSANGFPSNYGSWNRNIIANAQGDSVVVTPAAGDTLISIFIGMKQYSPFDLLHSTTPSFGYLQGLIDFSTLTPTVTDSQPNTWNPGTVYALNAGADYTGAGSDKWNLDGYFPSIFVAYASSVAAGSTTVTMKSNYLDGVSGTSGNYLASGKPVWDGGVDFGVFDFSNVGAFRNGASTGSFSTATPWSTSNPAVAGSAIGGAGDLIISVGLMPKGNVFAAPAAANVLAQGKLVGSEAHWMVTYRIATGASDYGFINPLGYEMMVVNYAFQSA